MKLVGINIVRQGFPLVYDNNATLYQESENIVLFYVHLKSKYCAVTTKGQLKNGFPYVVICATDRTMPINQREGRNKTTLIEFSDYSGWLVFEASIDSYTLSVCLTKSSESHGYEFL